MDHQEAEERARVVAVARTFLGTPYLDHGRVRGSGIDCAMLLAETFHEAVPVRVPRVDVDYYNTYWYLNGHERQRLIDVVERYARRVERSPLDGDIALFMPQRHNRDHRPQLVAHAGIIDSWPRVIHAWAPSEKVQYDDGDKGPLGATFVGLWSVWA